MNPPPDGFLLVSFSDLCTVTALLATRGTLVTDTEFDSELWELLAKMTTRRLASTTAKPREFRQENPMTTPPRRDQPKKHLDAAVVPIERALLARADVLDEQELAIVLRREFRVHGSDPKVAEQYVGIFAPVLIETLATEFRALAEELRYW